MVLFMTPSDRSLWQGRWIIAFSLLALASSGFGQTFFIAVFGAELRTAFALSHTAYGTLYSLATLGAAGLLWRAGVWTDVWPPRRVAAVAVSILALGCVLIGLAPHAALLGLGFLLIRFGGQGLLTHLAMTTAGRAFSAHRGKAIALTATGAPLAEACLPALAVVLIGIVGWRGAWLLGAALLLFGAWPLLGRLARHADHPPSSASTTTAGPVPRDFTRAEALRDPGLYLLLPAALATPFVVTAVLFHQAALAAARGWSLEQVAAAFSGFAAGHLGALLVTGLVVDRLGARRTLPLALLPMITGLTILAAATAPWVAFAYLGLTGMTLGGIVTAGGALWAERYGVRHLGAIRAVTQAAMVVATAVAPLGVGLLLDGGWSVAAIGGGLALGTALAALLAACARPPVR